MTLPGFVTRNFRLKVGCTIAAFVTWAGVVYASNPPETRDASVPVPQQQAAIPPKYTLVHAVPNLMLRLGGSRNSLDAFNVSSIAITVDWRAVTAPGIQTVPISISNSDPNVELIDPPQSITADIDTEDSTTVPVTIVVTRNPPAGYSITSETSFPSSVVVSGPHHELSGLQARVTADLTNFRTNFVEDAPVLIYDSRGDRLNDLTVSNPPGIDTTLSGGEVKVTITVSALSTTRASAVVPRISGSVAPGHQYDGVVVSPLNVLLAGPQNLLNALDSISTSTIDINGLTGSETFTVPLLPPAGISVTPGSVTVTVLVRTLPTPAPTATPTPSPSPSATPIAT